MEKKIILTDSAPAPIGPYSQAVMFNGVLYASGQIAINPETSELVTSDIESETRQVMENVKAVLTAAGMDFSNVIKSSIFLTDMTKFANVNLIYGSYFTSTPPARETIQVAALPKGVNVEISIIAGK